MAQKEKLNIDLSLAENAKRQLEKRLNKKAKSDIKIKTTVASKTKPVKKSAAAKAKLKGGPLDLSKRSNAEIYLADIKEFVSLNPKVLDPLIIAGSYSPSLQEVKSGKFMKSGAKFLSLVSYVRGSPAFSAYHKKKNKERAEIEKKKVASIRIETSNIISALKTRLESDPLAPDAYKIAAAIKKYDKLLKRRAGLSLLQKRRDRLVAAANGLGVNIDVKSGMVPNNDVSNRPKIRSSKSDLKEFADIKAEDFVVLANLNSTAPNAFRELSGKVVFENKRFVACAPSLPSIDPKYRAYFDLESAGIFEGHNGTIRNKCPAGLDNFDVLIVSGTDLAKSQDIPKAGFLIKQLRAKKLMRLSKISREAFEEDQKRRNALSSQYEADIKSGARIGFGAVAFENNGSTVCSSIKEGLEGHDQGIGSAIYALRLLNGKVVQNSVNVTETVAFKNTQRGQCALVYGSAATLQKFLRGAETAGLTPKVLPVWVTEKTVTARLKQLNAKRKASKYAEGKRIAALQRQQAEAAAKIKAEAEQLEARQKKYRVKYAAKVKSLVAKIDEQLLGVRDRIDRALDAKKGVRSELKSLFLWAALPNWYADQRMKGWAFESTVPAPKDYGIMEWRGRKIEAIVGQIRFLMKNRQLGDYSDTCWYVGYINDTEFSMYREYFISRCEDRSGLKAWKDRHKFETRWDLGVGETSR